MSNKKGQTKSDPTEKHELVIGDSRLALLFLTNPRTNAEKVQGCEIDRLSTNVAGLTCIIFFDATVVFFPMQGNVWMNILLIDVDDIILVGLPPHYVV